MTQYRGVRDSHGHAQVTVDHNGVHSSLPHFVHHSPTGMDWGYAGSGPADLARSLLAHHLGGEVAPSPGIYQTFKFVVVASLPPQGWTLSDGEIDAVLKSILKDQGVTCACCGDQGVLWPEQFSPEDSEKPFAFCACSAGKALVSVIPALDKS